MYFTSFAGCDRNDIIIYNYFIIKIINVTCTAFITIAKHNEEGL